jgi:hypothetical protein
MRKRILLVVAATASALAVGAALPPVQAEVGPVPAVTERAEAQSKAGGGGARAEDVGGNAAQLLQGWIGPLLLIFIGVLACVALFTRNVGMAFSVAIIGLIAGLFIFAPESAESLFRDIYDAIV